MKIYDVRHGPKPARSILPVFLSTPGDLQGLRKASIHVVDSLNDVFGPSLGWYIDLRRWEDKLPQYGRPQDIINPEIDSCELLIAALYKEWGSSTGKYSSGFEEEFERARKRKRETGTPEIRVFLSMYRPRISCARTSSSRECYHFAKCLNSRTSFSFECFAR